MHKNHSLSRRTFFKSATFASGAVLGSSCFYNCSTDYTNNKSSENLQQYKSKQFQTKEGITGLLFSQIGYELGYPVRIIVRLPQKELFEGSMICKLNPVAQGKKLQTKLSYWGEIWKSHWWIADFHAIEEEGEWNIEILADNECFFSDQGLRVGKNILWDSTIRYASVDILERRAYFSKVGAGWQDAGTLWVESPAQSAMIIALAELLEKRQERFDQSFRERIYKQITVGCDYLVMTQRKATEMGFPKGAMSHDLLGHEKDILPNDAMKATIALAKAVRVLPDSFEKKEKYRETLFLTYKWLVTKARPMGDYGFSRFMRGLPETEIIPKDEWQTRDLLTLCWAGIEIWKLNNDDAIKSRVTSLANEIMERQIPEEKNENGFFGHFLEYRSKRFSETSWSQGVVNKEFGADIGGFYPNYLIPLLEMQSLWPEHADAPKWINCLHQFAYGYLIPSCERNPFLLVPQGIFGTEGPVWFCGTFHGTNAIYGYTAALAIELANLFEEPRLKRIAYGNLQWLAGLNGGITREALDEGCVVFSTDIPKGVALPASMMCGVGKRWAGTWFQTRGIICNGFSTGKQFIYDTEPKKVNDGPFSLTDEDWIPHSAAWLTGMMRL